MDLLETTYENTEYFSLENKNFQAKVVRCYDGDTVTAIFNLYENQFFKFKIRIFGIDTPEIKSSNLKLQDLAKKSKKYLEDLVLDKIVTLQCKNFDKYGRILAEIFIENVNVSSKMLSEKKAYSYTGETKMTEEEQLVYFI